MMFVSQIADYHTCKRQEDIQQYLIITKDQCQEIFWFLRIDGQFWSVIYWRDDFLWNLDLQWKKSSLKTFILPYQNYLYNRVIANRVICNNQLDKNTILQIMIISKYSPDLQFPRKKYVLKNISQLLQAKTIDPPQLTLSLKMFCKSGQVSNQQSPKMNSSRIKKRSSSGINFQHYRTKSSIKSRFKIISENSKKQKQFQQKIKLSNYGQNNRNLFGKNIQANYRNTGSLPDKLFSNQALNKNSNSSKRRSVTNLQINEKLTQNEYVKRSQSVNKQYLCSKTASLALQKQQNKKFLRKGSSVHKQIVTNLLRNKLLRANQQIGNPEELQKYNSKQTIIEMINLYKGSPLKLENVLKKKEKVSQIQKKSTEQKIINGWEFKNDQTFTKDNGKQKQLSIQIQH